MNSRKTAFLLAALLLVAITTVAHARGNWSYWQSCGQDVSVSFLQVTEDIWTWKFRNDGATTITYMEFSYSDRDGVHQDVLPVSLRPGEAFGGWAAFTAHSWASVQIKTIRRQ